MKHNQHETDRNTVLMCHTPTNICTKEGKLLFSCNFWFTHVFTQPPEDNGEGAPPCKINKYIIKLRLNCWKNLTVVRTMMYNRKTNGVIGECKREKLMQFPTVSFTVPTEQGRGKVPARWVSKLQFLPGLPISIIKGCFLSSLQRAKNKP